jgi:hypothetical protein
MKKINHLHALLAKHKLKRGKFRGSGVNLLQERYNRLKPGDHVWDADLGYLVWNGTAWLSDAGKPFDLIETINSLDGIEAQDLL